VSEAERAAGITHGIAGDYVVARNGIDTTSLRYVDPVERLRVRQARGVADDVECLVCVGRISEQKGQDVLLSAWPRIARPDRRLVFVGEGPLLAQLRENTDDRSVMFLGAVDRALSLDWMTAADLVVLPSRWEGMALVPLESLAVGTPVVVTDVNGAQESVDRTVGRVCPASDAPALAAAITDWLDQPTTVREAARSLCRRRIEDQFDIRQTIATISQALTDVTEAP
jgi:glycosyltransferase involved in cell wall biosynthesis